MEATSKRQTEYRRYPYGTVRKAAAALGVTENYISAILGGRIELKDDTRIVQGLERAAQEILAERERES